MATLQPPPQLSLEGNLSENWKRFKQLFEIYLVASSTVEKTDRVQAMTFLRIVGPDAVEIYNTFDWQEEEEKENLRNIMEKFEGYCNPKKNVTYERHVFNTRNQGQSESIDAYVTDLRKKAKSCEFAQLHDSLIHDRVVCGVRNEQVRLRLLKEADLTL